MHDPLPAPKNLSDDALEAEMQALRGQAWPRDRAGHIKPPRRYLALSQEARTRKKDRDYSNWIHNRRNSP